MLYVELKDTEGLLDVLTIRNDGSGDVGTGHYDVEWSKARITARVEGFTRARGAWSLVEEALVALRAELRR